MKQPQQTFDVQPMARVRVRGTQDQIKAAHHYLLELLQQHAREMRKKFTVQLGSSGPTGGDNVKQYAMAFYIAPDLVDETRSVLGLLGLKEE